MKIAVLFGSRSTEHDVSIISALTTIDHLKKIKDYEITPLYITRHGMWEIAGNLDDIDAHRKGEAKGKNICLHFAENKKFIVKEQGLFGKKYEFDLVIPIFHGMNGEDGAIQGVLEMSQVPYTGSAILGSALGMDKIAMKDVLKSYNIPLVKYVSFNRSLWQLQTKQTLENVTEKLKFPIFIKPANLGSSIGISKANSLEELENSIEVAAYYDERIICEEGVENLMEINCAVVGSEYSANKETSLLEEPISYEDFLTFEEKYISEGGSMQGVKSKVKIPAHLPTESLTEEIQDAAKQVFSILHCAGVARIDFLVNTKTNEFFVNEINTIPGSLQMHLWEKSGYTPEQLLKKMVKGALERSRNIEKNSLAFQSDILNKGSVEK